jgi:predicted aspartyl protease
VSSARFNSRNGPILVDAEITGPAGSVVLKLVLDTGATKSLINLTTLLSLGFDPDQSTQRISMATGSSITVVPLVVLTRLSALGQHRFGFPVIARALPASSAVEGLLGLDFLRGQILSIDFRAGQITLA